MAETPYVIEVKVRPVLDFAEGHLDPETLPPWMYETFPRDVLGYVITAYLAGVEVGRANAANESDPDLIRLPSLAKPLCSDMYTEPGMRGFYLCRLQPGHDNEHASGSDGSGRTWPTATLPADGPDEQKESK